MCTRPGPHHHQRGPNHLNGRMPPCRGGALGECPPYPLRDLQGGTARRGATKPKQYPTVTPSLTTPVTRGYHQLQINETHPKLHAAQQSGNQRRLSQASGITAMHGQDPRSTHPRLASQRLGLPAFVAATQTYAFFSPLTTYVQRSPSARQ